MSRRRSPKPRVSNFLPIGVKYHREHSDKLPLGVYFPPRRGQTREKLPRDQNSFWRTRSIREDGRAAARDREQRGVEQRTMRIMRRTRVHERQAESRPSGRNGPENRNLIGYRARIDSGSSTNRIHTERVFTRAPLS